MTTNVTTIRASMLPGYPDCPRRAAAKQWRREIEAAGYELRETMPSVGAAVGTAVHAAAADVLRAKIETGVLPRWVDGCCADVALESFREEVEPGAEWDDTTPNRAAAEYQIARMTRVYVTEVACHIKPAAVELPLLGNLSDGWRLSGHLDVLTTDGTIRDLKTGALLRPYQAQLGGYALLAAANDIETTGVAVDFIRRTPRKKPQDAPVSESYDLGVSKIAAWSIIERTQQDVGEFRRRLNDGDEPPEEAFLANPMSMMCRPQFCPAHGTEFCRMGRP